MTKLKNSTILLVEDNPQDEMLTKRALEKANLANRIDVARDGAQAVDYLFPDGKARPDLPALILLDLRLPRLDGHQVLERIRGTKETSHLPVVILTSSDELSDVERSYASGANSYVRKPVKFDEFISAVQELGLYWMVINVPPPVDGP